MAKLNPPHLPDLLFERTRKNYVDSNYFKGRKNSTEQILRTLKIAFIIIDEYGQFATYVLLLIYVSHIVNIAEIRELLRKTMQHFTNFTAIPEINGKKRKTETRKS